MYVSNSVSENCRLLVAKPRIRIAAARGVFMKIQRTGMHGRQLFCYHCAVQDAADKNVIFIANFQCR